MPEVINNEPDGSKGNTGYSPEYVKELRDEAAAWRIKFREMETKLTKIESEKATESRNNLIQLELSKKSAQNVKPSWVEVKDGETPEIAVDRFLKDNPNFVKKDDSQIMPKKDSHRPMNVSSSNSNVENTQISELSAIKKDPIAREKLRGLYRGLLTNPGA